MIRCIKWLCVLPVAVAVGVGGAHADDPLPAWNDGTSKRAILEFVGRVTDEGSPAFVPVADRIATFDNDGTLWAEKPIYIHFYGVIAQMKARIAADPKLIEREPYRSAATKDLAYFTELYENSAFDSLAGQLFGVPFGGMTAERYDRWGREFLAGFTHPRFGVGVQGLIYQPMIELIRYLEANDFTVYIFTADEGAFLRLIAEQLYAIPPERVHGTSVRSEFVMEGDQPRLVRSYRIQHLNNWDGKPRLIQSVVGKKPVFAAGNSNGDQHMLQYAALAGGMSVLVHHTDAEREFAYDSHTDKVMPLAKKEGWTVVDMKRDWKVVFPSSGE
jgi:hypothetical protein